MKELLLKSTRRETTGKGQARLLRRKGIIPAILYGPGTKTVKLSLELIEIQKIFRYSKTGQFLINLEIDGDLKKVTIKELQKHPVSSNVLHIDFYEVAMDKKIKVSVPITTVGTSKGIEFGGMLQIVRREVEVLCLPNNIPTSIDINISDLDIGDSFHVNDLSLTDKIEIFGENNYTILTILNQKSTEESVEEVEEEPKETELT